MPALRRPSAPTAQPSPRDRRSRWTYLGAAAASAAVVAVGITLFLTRPLTDAAPPPTPTTSQQPTPGSTPTAAPDVTWATVAGVALPFSRTHGPRRTTDGAASGYARSLDGAAIAAAQVLLRTSPSAGPTVFEPVLATQLTGTNLLAMKLATRDEYQRLRAQSGVPDGAPIPDAAHAEVRGYVVRATDLPAGTVTVDVVLSAAQLDAEHRLVAFRLNLLWQNDDWRVVAPANGDWGTAATTLGASPSGLIIYGG